MKHDFADGKYTVINDNGNLTALRNGEPWGRDLVGDNLVYWMLVEVDSLKAQRDGLMEALNLAMQDWEKMLVVSSASGAHKAARAAIAKVTGYAK